MISAATLNEILSYEPDTGALARTAMLVGRVPSGQALAVPVEPVSRLDPSGFDPSRIMTELSALWFAYATSEGGHKDRDCHFVVEQYFSYGDEPYWTAYHAGYIDDGFGIGGRNERHERRFDTYAAALGYCIEETLAMFRRHHRDLSSETVARLSALATEARRAETENTGSVHEGAGPKDNAHD
jgi:hypothetical protein